MVMRAPTVHVPKLEDSSRLSSHLSKLEDSMAAREMAAARERAAAVGRRAEPSYPRCAGRLRSASPSGRFAVGWSDGLSPYKPTLRDGKLYGRGACDDGYSIFAAVTAIMALKAQVPYLLPPPALAIPCRPS